MKYYVWIGMAMLLAGCQKEMAEMPPEDYGKFISLKEADRLPLELGVPFNCFPKHPGDWGITPSDEFQREDHNTYSIELNFYTRADIHNRQDPTNLTAMVIQYLDADNRLVVDTLYDGKNCITSRERNGVLSFSGKQVDRTYTIEKKSGDLFYFAVFLSPYGRVDVSSEFTVNGDADDTFYGMQYEYSRNAESFHITDYGVDYLIYSKAMYLP